MHLPDGMGMDIRAEGGLWRVLSIRDDKMKVPGMEEAIGAPLLNIRCARELTMAFAVSMKKESPGRGPFIVDGLITPFNGFPAQQLL
jgi:hypothetical protein